MPIPRLRVSINLAAFWIMLCPKGFRKGSGSKSLSYSFINARLELRFALQSYSNPDRSMAVQAEVRCR